MSGMTVKQLAEFFGKSEKTIHRHTQKCGIAMENGKLTVFSRVQVECISRSIYQTVPQAVKSAIDESFGTSSNVQAKPLTNAEVENPVLVEAFRYMASAFDRLVQITQNQEARLEKIEGRIAERQALLPAPDIKPADHIRMLVNTHCSKAGVTQSAAYTELYRQMYYTYRRDINRLRANTKKTGIEIALEGGFIDELESLAIKLFGKQAA